MKGKTVYINGKYVDAKSARLSVFDRGFNYGDGLFETMKSVEGRVLFERKHLARIRAGARLLGVPTEPLKGIEKRIQRLIKLNGFSSGQAHIKLILTRGTDDQGFNLFDTGGRKKRLKPTVVITARRIDSAGAARLHERGVRAVLIKGLYRSPGDVKTLSYLPSVLARGQAEGKGAYEGIFTTDDGRLLEGAASNIFLVIKGKIATPPLDKAVLPGVVRGVIATCAKRANIGYGEGPVYVKDLTRCSEAFLTSSGIDVVPLVAVGTVKIGSGRPGRITRLIQDAYREYARRVGVRG